VACSAHPVLVCPCCPCLAYHYTQHPQQRHHSNPSNPPFPMPISARRSNRTTAALPTASNHGASPPSPRKRRSSHSNPSPSSSPPSSSDDASAEITRCVCGSQEYPFPESDVPDAGFMICCERCNVWQHGPCVGVMSEREAPEVYFCEECRPDLHELGSRNQG